MESKEQSTLLQYIQNEYFVDDDAILGAVLQLEDKTDTPDADTFVFVFLSNFNYQIKTCFEAIMLIVELSNLCTLDEFSDGIYQQAGLCATRYIGTLLCDPQLFDPNYTASRLQSELFNFFTTRQFSLKWVDEFVKTIKTNEGNLALAKVISNIATSVRVLSLNDASQRITIFSDLIYHPDIRLAYVNSPFFFNSFRSLFTKTIFPYSKNSSFPEYFTNLDGDLDHESPINQQHRTLLNTAMSSYHEALYKSIYYLLFKNTMSQTMSFVQKSLEQMEQKSKSFFSDRSTDNDEAFAFNFESILIRLALFARGGAMKRNQDIDPLSPYYPNSIAHFSKDGELALKGGKMSWISEYNKEAAASFLDEESHDGGPSIEELQLEWEKILKEQSKEPEKVQLDLYSQFFFAATKASLHGTIALVNLREPFIRSLMHTDNPQRRKVYHYLISSIIELLRLPFRKNDWLEFLQLMIQFLVKYSGYDQNGDNKLPKYPPQIYARFPESFVDLVSLPIFHLYTISFLNNNEVFRFLKPFVILFSNHRFIRNPLIKSNIIKLFGVIAREKEDQHFVISIPRILDLMFPSVFDFYNRAEHTGSSNQYYDRFNFRRDCITLLNFWFKFRDFREYFAQNFDLNTSFQIFVSYLISDTTYFANDAFTSLSEAIEFEESISSPYEITSSNELLSATINAKGSFKDFQKYLDVVIQISNFAPFIFDGPQDSKAQAAGIPDQASLLLLTVIEKSLKLSTRFPETAKKCHYKRNNLIYDICKILIPVFQEGKVLPLSFAKNPLCKKELLENFRTYVKSIDKELKKEDIDEDINNILMTINDINSKVTEDVNNSILDITIIPELFDPLMCNLLEDPVRSPSSGHIMSATL